MVMVLRAWRPRCGPDAAQAAADTSLKMPMATWFVPFLIGILAL